MSTLIKDPPPGAPVPPILPPQDGYLFLDKAKFPASFAADVDAKTAAFMADSQVPWGVGALSGTISEPAWKAKPSWYLVAADDKMIPPPAQRLMPQRAGSTVVPLSAARLSAYGLTHNLSSLCASRNIPLVVRASSATKLPSMRSICLPTARRVRK